MVAVGGLATAIPYMFWDLNEKKHKQIIKELTLRAEMQNVSDGYTDASVLSTGEVTNDVIEEQKELKRKMEEAAFADNEENENEEA